MEPWVEYLKFFAGLIAIVNPIGAIPIFISVTGDETESKRKRTALQAAITTVVILEVTLVAGEAVLEFFGISIASFRVAGGILILLMAISMMHARVSPVKHTEEEALDAAERDSVAVVPLGVPLLAGPGAMSTVIVYSHRSPSWSHNIILGVEILVVSLVTWICFRSAPLIARALGTTGINVVTRLMGLIMAAIGVEFITNGLKLLLPGLA